MKMIGNEYTSECLRYGTHYVKSKHNPAVSILRTEYDAMITRRRAAMGDARVRLLTRCS